MAEATITAAEVAGLTSVVPAHERSIDDEVEAYGGDRAQVERLKKVIGLHRRRVAAPGQTAADLAEVALAELLQAPGAPARGEVGALIHVTQTPDHFQPGNGCVLHGRLGFGPGCATFDVNLGCSGFVYALWLAHTLVAAGGVDHVLVSVADTISRQCHPQDRTVAPVFGDAAAAAWVRRAASPRPAHFTLHTDGTGREALIVPAGAFREPTSEATRTVTPDAEGNRRSREHLRMDGAAVFSFSLVAGAGSVQAVAARAGRSPAEADWVFFHQANRYIVSNLVRRLRLDPGRVPAGIVERFGNQSGASIPVAMTETLGPVPPEGERDVVLAGFGVGLSWAAAWLRLPPLAVCRTIDLRP